MNSKIRIEHDFDHHESYIAINLEEGDNNDRALKNFVEQVNNRGVELVYPRANQDNKTVFLKPVIVANNEINIVKQFAAMCSESLSTEYFAQFEAVYNQLFETRSALKGKKDLIE